MPNTCWNMTELRIKLVQEIFPSFPLTRQGLQDFIKSSMMTEGGDNTELNAHIKEIEAVIARANKTEEKIDEFNSLLADTKEKVDNVVNNQDKETGKI